jgi:hypothetical protein
MMYLNWRAVCFAGSAGCDGTVLVLIFSKEVDRWAAA